MLLLNFLIALFSFIVRSTDQQPAKRHRPEPFLTPIRAYPELPQTIAHQQLLKIHEDARKNGRVFKTSIVSNPPWPDDIKMNVSINYKEQFGPYAYYYRNFGTNIWIKSKLGETSIPNLAEPFLNVALEIPKHELRFDWILIEKYKFFHRESRLVLYNYFTSEIMYRPSTLSSVYTDAALRIYDSSKPNLLVDRVKDFGVNASAKRNAFDVKIALREPGVYGHYSRRIGESRWKRSVCTVDGLYERYGFDEIMWPGIPNEPGWQYRIIGRTDNDQFVLEKSKVVTIANCSGNRYDNCDYVLLIITDTGDINCL